MSLRAFVVWLTILTLIECIALSADASTNDFEKVWNNAMGNATNTRRLVTSIVTNFTGEPWKIELNASTGQMPM